MNKRKAITLLIALACGLVLVGVALAQSSPSYQLQTSVLDCGGREMTSTSYVLNNSMGQPSAIGLSENSSFGLQAGYWYTVRIGPIESRIYLPIVLKNYP